MECAVSEGHVDVSSRGSADSFGSAATHMSASRAADVEQGESLDLPSLRSEPCIHGFHCGTLYDAFDARGLQYGPGYRTLMQAWGGDAAAVSPLSSSCIAKNSSFSSEPSSSSDDADRPRAEASIEERDH